MAEELTKRTFDYHCIGDVCHCDWRVTITNCVESNAMRGVYIANIAISAFVFVIGNTYYQTIHFQRLNIDIFLLGVSLLIHRIFFKGHRLFDTGSAKGCLRPKPIDCMLLSLMIYNLRK